MNIAVSPDQVGFAESAGLAAVPYGPDARHWQDAHRDFLARFSRFWRPRELVASYQEDWQLLTEFWADTTTTLQSLADGADLIFTSVLGEEAAGNLAEYYDMPMATMHYFPMRPNGQLAPRLPAPVTRAAMTMSEWLVWKLTRKLDDAQRRDLGLPKAKSPSSHRIAARRSLEIQAYDEVCVPGLAAEWADFDGRRPFVGALTMELPADADQEVAAWIADGTPPIFFGFGSMPVESAVGTLGMISAACAELGERALVGSGGSDFRGLPHLDHVKVVDTMNYASAFPACRAVVHHGGVGTTAAGLRAGVPTLVLWTWADQKLWAAQVRRLRVGSARRFSATTRESLVADLRTIVSPPYVARAREIATKMTGAAESVTATADLLQDFARVGRVS